MHIFAASLFTSFLIAFSLISEKSLAQETESAYGRDQTEIFREKRVKEVKIELDPSSGKVAGMKKLEQQLLVNEKGLIIRRETASTSTEQLTHRHEKTYDKEGNLLTFTSFIRRSEANGTATAKVPGPEKEWVPYATDRYSKVNGKKPGSDRWNIEKGKWEPETTTRTYQKHDTTYRETKTIGSRRKDIDRFYQLGTNKTITRQDYLTYSEKGLSEPKYYYQKNENGRLIESGKVDFEMELAEHFQKHPELARYLFNSKYAFHVIYDEMARHTPGTLEPNSTYTYNAQGYLVAETSYGTKTTYQREPDGRLLSQKVVHEDYSGSVTNYFYNAKGLVEKTQNTSLDGTPGPTRYYHYTFY